MFNKIVLGIVLFQFIFLLNLKSKVEALEFEKQNSAFQQENTLIISSINEINDRLKFVEDGIPEITKRNARVNVIKEIVKENIRVLKVNNFKSDHEFNEYTFAVLEYSELYKVPVSLILAVSRAESNFNSRAISKTRAKGIMQIVDTTMDFCSSNLNKAKQDAFYVRDSVQCGTWYLKYLTKMFDGDINLAIKAYNAGPNFILKFNGENLPAETIGYHENVVAFMNGFKERIRWER